MLSILPELLISILLIGSIYALFGVSLNIAWSMSNFVNIGHGEVLTLGAYATLFISHSGAPLFLGFGALVLCTAVVPMAVYWLLLRVLHEENIHFGSILVSWGFSLLVLAGLRLTVGTEFQSVTLLRGSVNVFGLQTTIASVVVLVAALATSASLALVIRRTEIGRSLRAIVSDVDLATAIGINVVQMRTVAFVIAMLLAVLCGVLVSNIYVFYPFVGQLFVLKAIAVTLVAGFGRLGLSWIVGMGLGAMETIVAFTVGLQAADLVAFVMLVAVLLVRRDDIWRLGRMLRGRNRLLPSS